MYTFTIQKIYDQSACDYFKITRIYKLLKREYY